MGDMDDMGKKKPPRRGVKETFESWLAFRAAGEDYCPSLSQCILKRNQRPTLS
jgi:hypothetical protein